MKHILLEQKDQICTVTLNRPEKHNAFNPDMIRELTEVFTDLENQSDLKVVVLKGAGPSFSAGGDLEWMKSMIAFTYDENLADARLLFAMYKSMAECSLPLLGQVHGHIMGGGLGLVAVCDVVAAESQARFCFSETKIGLAPAVISPFVLRKVPQSLARDVMLSARMFGVDEAIRLGVIHFSGNQAETGRFISQHVEHYRQCAPGAVREAKRLLNFLASPLSDEVRERSAKVISDRRVSPEGQEGLGAFLEKREPSWRAKRP